MSDQYRMGLTGPFADRLDAFLAHSKGAVEPLQGRMDSNEYKTMYNRLMQSDPELAAEMGNVHETPFTRGTAALLHYPVDDQWALRNAARYGLRLRPGFNNIVEPAGLRHKNRPTDFSTMSSDQIRNHLMEIIEGAVQPDVTVGSARDKFANWMLGVEQPSTVDDDRNPEKGSLDAPLLANQSPVPQIDPTAFRDPDKARSSWDEAVDWWLSHNFFDEDVPSGGGLMVGPQEMAKLGNFLKDALLPLMAGDVGLAGVGGLGPFDPLPIPFGKGVKGAKAGWRRIKSGWRATRSADEVTEILGRASLVPDGVPPHAGGFFDELDTSEFGDYPATWDHVLDPEDRASLLRGHPDAAGIRERMRLSDADVPFERWRHEPDPADYASHAEWNNARQEWAEEMWPVRHESDYGPRSEYMTKEEMMEADAIEAFENTGEGAGLHFFSSLDEIAEVVEEHGSKWLPEVRADWQRFLRSRTAGDEAALRGHPVDDLPVPEEYLGELDALYEKGELIIANPTVGDLIAKADELEGKFWAKIEPGFESLNKIHADDSLIGIDPNESAEYIYTSVKGGGPQSIFRQLAKQGEVDTPYIVSNKAWEAGDDLWEAYVDDFLTRYPDQDPIIFLSREVEEYPSGGYRESGMQWSHLDAIGQSVREWLEGYALRKTARTVIERSSR